MSISETLSFPSIVAGTIFLNSPITCLKYIKGLIFAGEGPFIRVYSRVLNDSLKWMEIGSYAVFKSVNVHVLKADDSSNSQFKICAVGGKCVRIIQIDALLNFNFKFISPVFTFQDWIWDIQWFSDKQIGFLMAENYVLLWDFLENYSLKKFQCETKCALFCGCFVGYNWQSGIVMSGTVFKEVLIWSPQSMHEKDDNCSIFHRLLGHEGVIFNINYNEKLRTLCTASDDRSVHIWSHIFKQDFENPISILDWKLSNFTLLCKLYGHESRVCKAVVLDNQCVSAGEDSTLCFWKLDVSNNNFKLEKKIHCHAGSAIRSICIEDEMFTITGGNDGGIKFWPALPGINFEETNYLILKSELGSDRECSRELKLLHDDHILILTDRGRLLCYRLSTKEFEVWFTNIKVKSENVLDVIFLADGTILIAFGDLFGTVTVIQTCKKSMKYSLLIQFAGCPEKVLTVKWVETFYLLVCGTSGLMKLWKIPNINCNDVELIAKFDLPYCKHRWISAAKLCRKFHFRLLCGSRGGSVYVYDIPETLNSTSAIHPYQSFPRMHGTHGVSYIFVSDEDSTIYTTGRDGILSRYEMGSDGLTLLTKIRVAGCPKWISGLMFRDEDLFIYGFHDERFVLWSEKNQAVLTEIYCGGGHRSWDINFDGSFLTFVFNKDGEIGVSKKDLKYFLPTCVKSGNHIRHINVAKFLFDFKSKSFFATGSEDNTIRIWSIDLNLSTDSPHLEYCLKGHISSVKTIAITPMISNFNCKSFILVTAGGRAQLMCWKLTISSDVEAGEHLLVIQHLITYMVNPDSNSSRKPWKEGGYTIDPDTRFMDLAVWEAEGNTSLNGSVFIIAAACSDGLIRCYSYNVITNKLTLWVQHYIHGLHCVLKLCFLRIFKSAILITTATDGQLIISNITSIECEILKFESMLSSSEETSETLTCDIDEFIDKISKKMDKMFENGIINKWKLHQSGITSLSCRIELNSNDSNWLIIATGGDDTAINVVRCVISSSNIVQNGDLTFKEMTFVTVSGAHTAQVTGTVWLSSDKLVTTSADQRIKIWSSKANDDVELISSSYSNVADSSSMALLNVSQPRLVIVGKNFGIFKLKSR